jgi:hypothetical protein
VAAGALIALVFYQTIHIRSYPLDPLPLPASRRTGQPQQPNSELIAQPL